jgi:hypothetical protein
LEGTFIVLPGTPNAPTFVSKTSTSIVVLTSAAVTDADSYNLEIAIGLGEFATLQTGVTPLTEYSATGLSPSTTYYFRVVAININGSKSSVSLTVITDAPSYLLSDTNPDDKLISDVVTDPIEYLFSDNA